MTDKNAETLKPVGAVRKDPIQFSYNYSNPPFVEMVIPEEDLDTSAIDYLLQSLPDTAQRIRAWNEFMHQHYDYETGMFPSEEARRWADQEYVSLAQTMRSRGFKNVHLDMWW